MTTYQRQNNDILTTMTIKTEINDPLMAAKNKVRSWFRTNKEVTVANFFELYYGKKNSPKIRTVQRIIYSDDYPDRYNVWANVIEYYNLSLSRNEELARRIKKSL